MNDKEKVSQWMIERGFATGHGDSIEDLLKELEWQIESRTKQAFCDGLENGLDAEREACAKLVEADGLARGDYGYMLTKAATRIRARGAFVHASDMSQECVDETAKCKHEKQEEWAMQQLMAENQRLGLYDDGQPTCQDNRQVELKNALELQEVVKQFFERFLNRVEDSEEGKPFNPVIVSCCRALMIQPLSDILERMRVLSGAKPNPLYEENK